jgi:hypothetical protein
MNHQPASIPAPISVVERIYYSDFIGEGKRSLMTNTKNQTPNQSRSATRIADEIYLILHQVSPCPRCASAASFFESGRLRMKRGSSINGVTSVELGRDAVG